MSQDQTTQTQQEWRKMVDEQLSRLSSGLDEAARMEARSADQARAAIEELARLAKESLTWSAQMTAEWRRLTLEGARRAVDLMTARG
jgi:hypothetical protein